MEITSAVLADCPELAATSKQAFDADVEFGAPGPGGPPGYDSIGWHQRALGWGDVLTFREAGAIVGGAIVIRGSGAEATLGRIWLTPALQGGGRGVWAMAQLESRFPDVRRWTLETPDWNERTRRFYPRCGYRDLGRNDDGQRQFEKWSSQEQD